MASACCMWGRHLLRGPGVESSGHVSLAELLDRLPRDEPLTNLMRTIYGGKADGVDSTEPDGGLTALMMAAKMGSLEHFQVFLHAGADPKLKDLDGNTALTWAAREGHVDIVEALVTTCGAYQSEGNNTSLTEALDVAWDCQSNGKSLEVARYLWENGFRSADDAKRTQMQDCFKEATPSSDAAHKSVGEENGAAQKSSEGNNGQMSFSEEESGGSGPSQQQQQQKPVNRNGHRLADVSVSSSGFGTLQSSSGQESGDAAEPGNNAGGDAEPGLGIGAAEPAVMAEVEQSGVGGSDEEKESGSGAAEPEDSENIDSRKKTSRRPAEEDETDSPTDSWDRWSLSPSKRLRTGFRTKGKRQRHHTIESTRQEKVENEEAKRARHHTTAEARPSRHNPEASPPRLRAIKSKVPSPLLFMSTTEQVPQASRQSASPLSPTSPRGAAAWFPRSKSLSPRQLPATPSTSRHSPGEPQTAPRQFSRSYPSSPIGTFMPWGQIQSKITFLDGMDSSASQHRPPGHGRQPASPEASGSLPQSPGHSILPSRNGAVPGSSSTQQGTEFIAAASGPSSAAFFPPSPGPRPAPPPSFATSAAPSQQTSPQTFGYPRTPSGTPTSPGAVPIFPSPTGGVIASPPRPPYRHQTSPPTSFRPPSPRYAPTSPRYTQPPTYPGYAQPSTSSGYAQHAQPPTSPGHTQQPTSPGYAAPTSPGCTPTSPRHTQLPNYPGYAQPPASLGYTQPSYPGYAVPTSPGCAPTSPRYTQPSTSPRFAQFANTQRPTSSGYTKLPTSPGYLPISPRHTQPSTSPGYALPPTTPGYRQPPASPGYALPPTTAGYGQPPTSPGYAQHHNPGTSPVSPSAFGATSDWSSFEPPQDHIYTDASSIPYAVSHPQNQTYRPRSQRSGPLPPLQQSVNVSGAVAYSSDGIIHEPNQVFGVSTTSSEPMSQPPTVAGVHSGSRGKLPTPPRAQSPGRRSSQSPTKSPGSKSPGKSPGSQPPSTGSQSQVTLEAAVHSAPTKRPAPMKPPRRSKTQSPVPSLTDPQSPTRSPSGAPESPIRGPPAPQSSPLRSPVKVPQSIPEESTTSGNGTNPGMIPMVPSESEREDPESSSVTSPTFGLRSPIRRRSESKSPKGTTGSKSPKGAKGSKSPEGATGSKTPSPFRRKSGSRSPVKRLDKVQSPVMTPAGAVVRRKSGSGVQSPTPGESGSEAAQSPEKLLPTGGEKNAETKPRVPVATPFTSGIHSPVRRKSGSKSPVPRPPSAFSVHEPHSVAGVSTETGDDDELPAMMRSSIPREGRSVGPTKPVPAAPSTWETQSPVRQPSASAPRTEPVGGLTEVITSQPRSSRASRIPVASSPSPAQVPTTQPTSGNDDQLPSKKNTPEETVAETETVAEEETTAKKETPAEEEAVTYL